MMIRYRCFAFAVWESIKKGKAIGPCSALRIMEFLHVFDLGSQSRHVYTLQEAERDYLEVFFTYPAHPEGTSATFPGLKSVGEESARYDDV